jgi:glutamate-1-semialdehyde 2,1-aminomutase
MFGLFFSDEEKVSNFAQASNCNIDRFKAFYQIMLTEGVYLAPSAYEAGFVSGAHGKDELDKTIDAARKAFSKL